jgi:hypothetical protein
MVALGAGHLLKTSAGLPMALSLISSITKVSFTGSPLAPGRTGNGTRIEALAAAGSSVNTL